MRIRSKLVVLIAVPLIALATAAAFGFTNQSVQIEKAEDSSAAVEESKLAFAAILAVGDERLGLLGADVGEAEQLTEATDLAVAELQANANSPEAAEAATQVEGLISGARQLGRGDALALFGSAEEVLLEVASSGIGIYPTAETRTNADITREAIDALSLREAAWVNYLATDLVNTDDVLTLGGDFDQAKLAIENTRTAEAFSESTILLETLQSDSGLQLAELEVEALRGLPLSELTVGQEDVLQPLGEFRTEWGNAIRDLLFENRDLVDAELADANSIRSLFALLAGLGVVVLLGLIFVIYRSITNPLESLLARASTVANEELPYLVNVLRHDDGSAELPVADPIPVTSEDEIGELVVAFNDVQATAYDLATEQALGRRNVADMFVNLGRRNQQLLQRILAQLTQLEQNEEDPDKLRDLFELDNVVTRMRRNAESLLALAGAQTTRQWSQPITIDNTVRAAFGEVEGYERIDVAELPEIKVVGSVVADVTHLLAELLENALNFSEPTTSVVVNGRTSSEGYIVSVIDQGIGMSQPELDDNNTRISDPPPLDQVPTRFLGLYVVGRLAERHNIKVRLLETSSGGIAAKVILPNELLAAAGQDTPSISSTPTPEVTPVSETESSPLEGKHDLDAELAEMTAEVLDDNLTIEPIIASPQEPGGPLPTRTRKDRSASAGTAVAEPEKPVKAEEPKKLDTASDTENSTDDNTEDNTENNTGTDTGLDSDSDADADSDSDSDSDSDESKVSEQSEADIQSEANVQSEAAPAEADEPAGDELGLPVRKRGGALDEVSTPVIDRAAIKKRAATDSSPEAAGNFSSMMSALTSGVARGLEESEHDGADIDRDESKDGNDQ